MKADLVLYNAKIYTVDPAQPWAEAVACKNGRIWAVGSNSEIRGFAGPKTRQINGNGRLVLPGLTDAHVHFLRFAIQRQQISLFGLSDLAQVRQRIAAGVAQAEPGQWILGWGWDEHLWELPPTRQILDELAPDNPVALIRMDMHTWWVNSVALERAHITVDTPDPPEGKIERDENGRPTGLLREWNAIQLVERHIPEPDDATLADWLAQAIRYAHQLGITSIHDQRLDNEGPESFRLWQALNRKQQLNLRVHMNISADRLSEAAALGLQPGFGDDRLWIGHAKTFADGTMGSHTALMLAPFSDDPGNLGLAVTPAGELQAMTVQAGRAGFPMSVHAIGDKAVRDMLDVVEEWGHSDAKTTLPLPHRLEHVQLIHPDDLPRLAQLGVVASVQPVHLMTDWATADKVWGERARYAYAFRSLLEAGTAVVFGSDAPVAPLNPMLGFYAALTRQDSARQPAGGWYPQEKLTLEEVIAGYTMGPARLAGQASQQGSITPGKWADLVMFAADLFETEPEAMAEARVAMTIFAGEIVYQE